MSASSCQVVGSFDESDFDIREQGDDDVLLDLGSQVFVAEEVDCEEKDVAFSVVQQPLQWPASASPQSLNMHAHAATVRCEW